MKLSWNAIELDACVKNAVNTVRIISCCRGACCGNHLHRVDLRAIFGCHPGDYIVSISMRVNDMLMLCKFASLFLIVVFARAHLMFLPHPSIKSSKLNTINISAASTSEGSLQNFRGSRTFKGFVSWTVNTVFFFCHNIIAFCCFPAL